MLNLLVNSWVIINSFLYILLGLFSFIKPLSLSDAVGIRALSPKGFSEIYAMYGGLMIAIGILISILYFYVNKNSAIISLTIIYLGFAFGRFVGMVRYSSWNSVSISYLTFELIAVLLSSYSLYVSQNIS